MLLISNKIFSQAIKIEIRSDSLFVNSQIIANRTTPTEVQSIFGKPDRRFSLANIIWTYDQLGLRIYISPEDSSVSISLDFVKETYEFSPKKAFAGTLIINNKQITKKTSIADFQEIKDIGFKFSVLHMYRASAGELEFIFTYSVEKKQLEGASISFKGNENDKLKK